MEMKKVIDAEGNEVDDFRKLIFVKYQDTWSIQLLSTQYHILFKRKVEAVWAKQCLQEWFEYCIYNPLINKDNNQSK